MASLCCIIPMCYPYAWSMIHYPIYHPTHPPMPHRIILHLPYTSFLRIFFHNPSYTSSTPCIILSTHHPYIIHPPSLCHSPSHPIIPSSICSSDLVRHVKLDNYSYYVVDQEYIMHTWQCEGKTVQSPVNLLTNIDGQNTSIFENTLLNIGSTYEAGKSCYT